MKDQISIGKLRLFDVLFLALIGFISFSCSKTAEQSQSEKVAPRQALQAKLVYYAMPG